ncbi:hypothetical protein [Urechidicola vernalis]|uniref:Secreted protein n=1 Tax=Urechidicola vernalis TaxID=3075600 RepID=A0ABU2Y6F0_9FLAO|nr:hypothetical protein [Urechidicola sp. P050]MDT0552628.1 hypothetical protein [Urechidicola sp. P050]
MKKTVKFLSGTALAVSIAFVGFSSFTTPAPEEGNDCGCPPEWIVADFVEEGWRLDNPNILKRDKNGDGVLCLKYIDGEGNTESGKPGKVWKDNNQPCK